MIIPDNHQSIRCGEKITSWMKSNLGWLNPLSLSYSRIICGKGILTLNSDTKWHQIYWDEELQKNVFARVKSGINIWNADKLLSKETFTARKHNISRKIDLVFVTEEEANILSMGLKSDCQLNTVCNNISRLYLVHAELLRISQIMESESRTRLYLPIKTPVSFQQIFTEQVSFNKKSQISFNRKSKYCFSNYCFTFRELQCICLRVSGLSYKEIAELIHLSYDTVKDYITRVIARCHIGNSRQDLFIFCNKIGITKCLNEFVTPLLPSPTYENH